MLKNGGAVRATEGDVIELKGGRGAEEQVQPALTVEQRDRLGNGLRSWSLVFGWVWGLVLNCR